MSTTSRLGSSDLGQLTNVSAQPGQDLTLSFSKVLERAKFNNTLYKAKRVSTLEISRDSVAFNAQTIISEKLAPLRSSDPGAKIYSEAPEHAVYARTALSASVQDLIASSEETLLNPTNV